MKTCNTSYHHAKKMDVVLLRFICLLIVMSISARAQDLTKATTPKDLIYALEAAIEKNEQNNVVIIAKKLNQYGDEAIPWIRSALNEHNSLFRATLIKIVGGIKGERAMNTLLELTLQNTDLDVSAQAMACLENRTISRALSKEELRILLSRIENSNVIQAGLAARLLANCTQNDAIERAMPIITRFKFETESPSFVGDMHGSYLSGEVFVLNQFLIAFSAVSDSAIIPLLRNELQKRINDKLHEWLIIALGMVRDEAVSEELLQIVHTENDASARAVALRAYARVAKAMAIPTLKSFVDDRTSIDKYTFYGELFPLQIVARDELARLNSVKEK